jgi:hypothetical protein
MIHGLAHAIIARDFFTRARESSYGRAPSRGTIRPDTAASAGTQIAARVRDMPQREDESMARDKIHVEQHSVGGLLWLAGWLFTIGFLKLTFGKGLLALLLWPYYLGVFAGMRP